MYFTNTVMQVHHNITDLEKSPFPDSVIHLLQLVNFYKHISYSEML